MTTLKEATARELLKEFMTRGCSQRRAAVYDELDEEDVRVAMEVLGISGYSSEDVDEAEENGREKGAKEEREKLLALMAELAFSASPDAQVRVRDYLFREHGITNIYAARLFLAIN